MSVYKPAGCAIWQIDFWHQNKRFCKSSGETSCSAARRQEKRWKAELKSAAGVPSLMRPKGGKTFHEAWQDY
jgi:hypothetical protein